MTETKSGRSRKIPLSTTLLSELDSRKKSAKYVFTNPKTGDRYTTIKNGWSGLCKAAEIKGLRFHDLRHTAATRMVSKGIDLAVVQEILGHSQLTITQRYSHPLPIRKAEAIKVLDTFGQFDIDSDGLQINKTVDIQSKEKKIRKFKVMQNPYIIKSSPYWIKSELLRLILL